MADIQYRIDHVGINGANAEEARAIAELFFAAFGLLVNEGERSIFSGNAVETMKGPFRGKLGHIAMGTPDCEAAILDLRARGFDVDMSTACYNPDGTLKAVYLEKEIGGFAVHIMKQKP